VLSYKTNGSIVIDLFSGSGSLGIEALSRGAKIVYFVDDSIKSLKLINSNINLLKDLESDYKIIKSDAVRFIKNSKGLAADIIFIDPPYSIDFKVMKELFASIKQSGITSKTTEIVYEYFFKRDISSEIEGLKKNRDSFFGDKIVSYISI
jgi:16S rRNA (guanine966-N2)-methyltransferase